MAEEKKEIKKDEQKEKVEETKPIEVTPEVVEDKTEEKVEVATEEVEVKEPIEEEVILEDKSKPKEEIPDFRVGDTVKVNYKIIEGDKTRLQPYQGIVIAKKGTGVSKTFTVRKISVDNVGVERIFPLSSPNIDSLKVVKRGSVRRAKLYYLRDRVGKQATRIKEKH